MKKHINIIQKLFVFAVAISLVGCSVDDIEPYNKLTSENTIRDEASAQKVLNGVYDLGRDLDIGAFPLYLAAYGDEGVITSGLTGQAGFNTNEVPVENRYLANLYNAEYKIINTANFLIQELENGKAVGLDEDRKNEMIAEAKVQRALRYFNLLRYFGYYFDQSSQYGLVLRTTFATKVEAAPRSSVEETYDLIASDLEYAMEYGPQYVEHYYTGDLAAKAFLAKVELYRGNYSRAASLAQEVINNGQGYELEMDYKDIFINQYNSSEVIFAPFAGPGAEGGSNMNYVSRTDYSEYLRSTADAQVGDLGDGSLTGTGSGYDYRFSFAYSDATKGPNKNGKYPYLSTTSAENNTLYYLRLGEIYLIHAEAEARLNNTAAALESLNIIRERAGLEPKSTMDQQTLLEDIRQEKLLELFFENGEPLFDLVRYDVLGNISAESIKETLNNRNKFVLPIPAEVLIGNSEMVQNPGY